MIFSYILSFTILITSGIWMADVILKLDRELAVKKIEFVKETKSLHLHKNKKGSITLTAIFFLFIISGLFLFLVVKNNIELKEAEFRKESYLCFLYLNIQTENYIKDLSKFNIALRSLYAAQFADLTGATSTLFESTKVARDIRHFDYVKTLLKNNYCPYLLSRYSYIKNFPYEINPAFILQTNIDATTKLKEHKWKNIYSQNPDGIRIKNFFCLEVSFKISNAFIPNLETTTTEIGMEAFSKLKCLSGYR